jgi:hypothetical protein
MAQAYLTAARYQDDHTLTSDIGEKIRETLEYTYRQTGHATALNLTAWLGALSIMDDTLDIAPYVNSFLDSHLEWMSEGSPVTGDTDVEDNAYLLGCAFLDYLGMEPPYYFASNVAYGRTDLKGSAKDAAEA